MWIVVAALLALRAQDASKNADRMSASEARKLKNPIAYSKKSISDGKTLFLQNCTGCHGRDGKAQVDVIADATDLTSPKLYKSGTSEGEIFRSIRDGAGETMPPFKAQLSNDDMWNLVNFIRSLWPEADRPVISEKQDRSEHAR